MSTIFSRKNVDSLCRALVQQYNALHDSVAVSDGYSSNHFHRDISGVPSGDFSAPSSSALAVSAATASDSDTTVALANNILGVLQAHFADDCSHLVADTVNGSSAAALSPATTLLEAQTLLNVCRGLYQAHRSQSGVHVASDTVNAWTGAPATDLGSAKDAANFGKATINDHILCGPTVGRIKLLDG